MCGSGLLSRVLQLLVSGVGTTERGLQGRGVEYTRCCFTDSANVCVSGDNDWGYDVDSQGTCHELVARQPAVHRPALTLGMQSEPVPAVE